MRIDTQESGKPLYVTLAGCGPYPVERLTMHETGHVTVWIPAAGECVPVDLTHKDELGVAGEPYAEDELERARRLRNNA